MNPERYCSVNKILNKGYDNAQINEVAIKEIIPKYSKTKELLLTWSSYFIVENAKYCQPPANAV